jgi:hypothetical protein
MKVNLAAWDRTLRFILGVMMTAWVVAGGPWWAYFGVYLIFSASWGICPIYSFFKIRTARTKNQTVVPPEL